MATAATEDDQAADKTAQSWVLAIYGSAITDIRWAKEQSWKVVQWSFALFGGIIALYRFPFANLKRPSWLVFPALAIGAAAGTIFYLLDLHRFAKESRHKTDRAEDEAPRIAHVVLGEPEREEPVEADALEQVKKRLGNRKKRDRNHRCILGVQIAVVVLSAILTVWGLSGIHALPDTSGTPAKTASSSQSTPQ